MKTGIKVVSWRFLRIWQRNWDVYARTWKINFIPPILEPILYLVAFGAGLGYLVGEIPWEGRRIGYTAFIAPGLLSINIMQNSFFETTYTSFVRMYYQKTFDAILATPLNLEEIILGEIVWGATRSLLATAVMLAVLSCFGILSYPSALLILPVAFLGGLAFGAAGMCFTGIIPTIEVFNIPVFLFVTPMFLFSGTFFPLDQLPAWARTIAYCFPLTHIVELCRPAALGVYKSGQVWAVIYLSLFSMVAVPLALFLMRRRLIR